MSLIEGLKVSYIGDPGDDLDIGDTGKVIASDGQASHIRWLTGKSEGQITFNDDFDLVVISKEVGYDDLMSGSLVTVAVRNTFDKLGQAGLLNALNDEGHLSVFQPIAEEAISMVAARIRQDASFVEVLSELDSEEGNDFVTYASLALLNDAFGDREDI